MPASARDPALRVSLTVWVALACVLLLLAPPPPPPPVTTGEDEAIFQRTVDQTVEKTRRWQQERGDLTIDWDDARGHLAIVIVDVGHELHLLEQLQALRFPLSFAVSPDAVYTPGVQLRLRGDRRRPREILLHLPGAEVDLTAALDRVPSAVGVMVSARATMAAISPMLRTRGLFVLDAEPTQGSSGPVAAAVAGVPMLAGDIVLDVDPTPGAVLAQLELAARRARDRPVVIIAHPSQAVVEVLRDGLPRLHRDGIGVYPVQALRTRGGEPSAQ